VRSSRRRNSAAEDICCAVEGARPRAAAVCRQLCYMHYLKLPAV
jgi:hypothetical protein